VAAPAADRTTPSFDNINRRLSMQASTSRRAILTHSLALGATLALPSLARAQADAIRLGTLTPLTGAGGPYGPLMASTVKAVVDEVNGAGGVLGRKIVLSSEDDQTNPEAGVRAARKLIDVDKVSAIIGTWASSVTTAVAPLCWESKTFLATVSGADSITALPHQGYLVRTQPNTTLQGRKFAEFALQLGARKLFFMSPQTPFFESQLAAMRAVTEKAGGKIESLVYDDKKPSLRTEVDSAMRFAPDLIVLGGYTPDTTTLLKDLYRANYKGKMLGFGYSVNEKLTAALPANVLEGIYTLSPSSDEGSSAYKRVAEITKSANPDPYSCQVYDHVNLILLAMASAKASSGLAIKEAIRNVSQGSGERVESALTGLKLLAAGKQVNYSGASGPCDFTDAGDITDSKFRYLQVKGGKLVQMKIA
jgi:branched-chain amino acid transport system substrate-binding protein